MLLRINRIIIADSCLSGMIAIIPDKFCGIIKSKLRPWYSNDTTLKSHRQGILYN